jgi:hypothetical protein
MGIPGIAPVRGDQQPPYISFVRFRDRLDQLAANRLPERLNPDAWGAPSQGADRFTNALRFFGLITRDLAPEWELRQFVRANATDRRGILRNVVVSRFKWATQLPTNTSYQDFLADLGRHCALTGERRTRAASFVIAAAEDLGIPIPVVRPRKGRHPSAPSAPAQTGALQASDLLGTVKNHSAYLLEQAKRASRQGDIERERYYLEQLGPLSLALLESGRSTNR